MFTQLGPPLPKGRAVHRHATADNGDEPTARLEPQESLLQMSGTESRLVTAHPPPGGRKRRVHHDGMVLVASGQQIVEPLRIERERLESLQLQKLPSARIDFVRIDLGACQPCQCRDVSGASARFEHAHAGLQSGRFDDQEGLRRGRAELLPFHLVLVAPSLKREARLLRQELFHGDCRVLQFQTDAMQVDVEPGLRRVVSIAGVPRGGAENLAGQFRNRRVIEAGRRVSLQGGREP